MTTYETLAELWRKGMEHSAASFRHRHPAAYRKMVDGAMSNYRGELGGFDRRMQQLERQCATAMGWPPFDLWLQRQSAA